MMSNPRESSRRSSFNTTRPWSSLIPEEPSPRSSVVRVPAPDSRSLTDERRQNLKRLGRQEHSLARISVHSSC
jgi:hypothetical protein